MRKMTVIFGAQLLLPLVCAAANAEACRSALRFQSGAVVYEDAAKIILNVSISPENFTPHDLLCLAEELKSKYSPGREEAVVSIFDDSRAAALENLRAATVEARKEDYEIYQHQHASYIFKRRRESYLVLEPDPRNETTFTRMPTEAAQTLSCRIAIGRCRCLMIAGHLEYPMAAWRNSIAGDIEIDVKVSKTGLVAAAQPREQSVSIDPLLRDAAMNDVQSWQFEPGATDESINVTYSFRLRGSSDTYARSSVKYDLPNRVLVVANPPR
jgi:TonB family protein